MDSATVARILEELRKLQASAGNPEVQRSLRAVEEQWEGRMPALAPLLLPQARGWGLVGGPVLLLHSPGGPGPVEPPPAAAAAAATRAARPPAH